LRLLGFAIHPHLDHEWFPENTLANLEKLAATIPVPSYLIDDQSAVIVTNDGIEMISEGDCKFIQGR
jgi:dipeptidase E